MKALFSKIAFTIKVIPTFKQKIGGGIKLRTSAQVGTVKGQVSVLVSTRSVIIVWYTFVIYIKGFHELGSVLKSELGGIYYH